MNIKIFTTAFFILVFTVVFGGSVTINGVIIHHPTCVNNGTMTVVASEGMPQLGLFYSISGPVNSTNTTGIFNSLPEGSYYVKVFTLADDSAISNVVLTSSYIPPAIQNVTTVVPYCDNDSDGSITGILQPGTGFGPFQWRLDTITGSTIRPFQGSSTFTHLRKGRYRIILQDCANEVSYTVVFSESGNEFRDGLYGNGFPTAEKIHCDTFMIRFGINHNLIDTKPPYRLRVITPNGTFWYNHSEITFMQEVQDVWFVSQKVGGLAYGDEIDVCFFNNCNDSISFRRTIARVEDFTYNVQLLCNGNVRITARYSDARPNLMTTGLFAPVSFELIDASTNIKVFTDVKIRTQSEILFEQFGYSMVLSTTMTEIPNNSTYYFGMEDACGLQFTDTITINAVEQPLQLNYSISFPNGCKDSTVGAVNVGLNGFNTPVLTVLSGPMTLQSTNPLYAYSDVYVYPKSFTSVSDLDGNSYLGLWNLAAGTYQVNVTDACGRNLDTVIIIRESSIRSLAHNFTYTPGCGNNNTIQFTLQNSHSGNVTIGFAVKLGIISELLNYGIILLDTTLLINTPYLSSIT